MQIPFILTFEIYQKENDFPVSYKQMYFVFHKVN